MTKRSPPRHIGFIPDGNRQWAVGQGLSKQMGYQAGVEPGLALYQICKRRGIPEVSVYGFTQDNTKRPSVQIEAFRSAFVWFALEIARRGAALLVVGDVPHRHGRNLSQGVVVARDTEADLVRLDRDDGFAPGQYHGAAGIDPNGSNIGCTPRSSSVVQLNATARSAYSARNLRTTECICGHS